MKVLGWIVRVVDGSNELIGKSVAWLVLLMVLTQFVVVVMRYVFGIGSVAVQESIVYMHATVFLVGAGYTLRHNGHVRCDIFYASATPRRRALVDLFGVFVFLIPMVTLIGWVSWPYVVKAWAVHEGSPEGRLGIPAVFLLKSAIPAFAVLVVLQGLAMAARSVLLLLGGQAGPGRPADAGHGDA